MAERPKVRPSSYGGSPHADWTRVDWSEHRRSVEVQGRRVNVVDWRPEDPDAPTMVFLHGLSGCWQNWLENLPAFARTHRVIAPDLPGFGESEMPVEDITISGYGRFVDALLDVLEVREPIVLVGNSMGGFVGAEVAIRFPARVDRLVLVSAAGLSIEHMRNDRLLAGLQRADELLIAFGAWSAGHLGGLIRRPRGKALLLGLVAYRPDRLPAPLVAELVKGQGKRGFVPALDALTSYPIRDRLGEIGCPTLVVWGDKDRLVPVKDAWLFGELVSDSRVVVYEGVGHVAMVEVPEDFNALVGEFVREDAGERVGASDARA
ncbi:alpha/beta fold hydrolase [Conexibacter sp. SYSU D00693]|uniref:alpha/beta fold hydrolase n=1 Tax=Conexibacter sp. SYSU D00693 TaxID=2812560 RepID=UPI00196A2B88|nr:alpha/beta fold hydrolase [Conexibacter sp. SYSU D00693]